MGQQWFYAKGATQYGPVDEMALSALAARAELSPEDLLWRPGLESWIKAETLPGLFSPPPVPAPIATSQGSAARSRQAESLETLVDHKPDRGPTPAPRGSPPPPPERRAWSQEFIDVLTVLGIVVVLLLVGVIAALLGIN